MADLRGQQIKNQYQNLLTKGSGNTIEDGDGVQVPTIKLSQDIDLGRNVNAKQNINANNNLSVGGALEASNSDMVRSPHEIGGRSRGDVWTEAGTNSLPVALGLYSSIVYDGKMWVIGGHDDTNEVETVYYSITTVRGGLVVTSEAIRGLEMSADPPDPPEGSFAMWMSDGTGSGSDGDLMYKRTAGGVTTTSTVNLTAV